MSYWNTIIASEVINKFKLNSSRFAEEILKKAFIISPRNRINVLKGCNYVKFPKTFFYKTLLRFPLMGLMGI